MQRLYENYKLLTYPRTDSRFITNDMVGTLKDRVKACGVGPYSKMAAKILMSPIKENKSYVDNSKVSDHHAIIPTEQPSALGSLSDSEKKVYDLVVKRFLAALYPPFEYEQTTIKAKIGDEMFTASGKIVKAAGWKEVYENKFEDEDTKDGAQDQILPNVKKGEVLDILSITQTNGMTKPPAPFNEATLLSAMENPVKYMDSDNKELNKIIGETGGLGTVATRADIIEKLFNSFVVEKRGKDIFVTQKGKQLLELVPEDLKSPTLTAKWEQKLASIAKGTLNKNLFINDMRSYAQQAVDEIKRSEEKYRHTNMTRSKCPNCGKFMLEVKGKNGMMHVCQDRECGFRKGVARVTNARCPTCHKKLELKGEGEGQIFVCGCGYREKLSAFNERRSKEDSKVSKQDVSRYLNNQEREAGGLGNSALADALSKLKLK
jgi:DNA topoisomerase III